MSNVTEGKQSALRRVLELLSLMPVHYIYDSNQQVWRQVEEGVGDWVIFGVFNARAQDVLISKDFDAPSCLGLHV